MNRAGLRTLALILAVTVLTAAGCASTKVTDWTGHPIDEVVKKFGPPTRTVPIADGGTMYVWELQRSIPESNWVGSGQSARVVTTTRHYTSTKTFWVRPDGIIASWNSSD